ncbi:hypothetical protein [Clostridium sp.]|uniref:hypothetical protein n=1 Tax=Clostridium sp. TaxID=1506 RepID=UPI001B6BF689|nr:hypothetical protein [Clostridium sp.]MBP3916593.1 hypothetical protein [Clostridium sp.]
METKRFETNGNEDKNIPSRKGAPWEEREIEFLKNNYLTLKSKEIAKVLNRTEVAVSKMKDRLGLVKRVDVFREGMDVKTFSGRKYWTEEEVEFLKNNYLNMSLNKIAETLNRTESSVEKKMLRLNLKGRKRYANIITVEKFSKITKVSEKKIRYNMKYNNLPIYKCFNDKGALLYWNLDVEKFWEWLKMNEEFSLAKMEPGALGEEPEWMNQRRMMYKDSLLRMYYDEDLTIKEIAKVVGVSALKIEMLFDKYKINKNKLKFWTEEEEEFLRVNYGHVSIGYIAKKLKRSVESVKFRSYVLKLGRATDVSEYLTLSEFIRTTNVSREVMRKLIKYHNFPAKKKVVFAKQKVWRIGIEDFWKWTEQNQDLINLSDMEYGILGAEPEWMEDKRKRDAKRKKREFTEYENTQIEFLYKRGHNFAEIAKILDRPYKSVYYHAGKIGVIKTK